MPPNAKRVEKFLEVYTRHMRADIEANPTRYHERVRTDPEGAARLMVTTLANGTATTPSPNLKKTCKELDIGTSMRNMIDWLQTPDPA